MPLLPDESDSVDRDRSAWTDPMVDVDPSIEAARQRIGRLSRMLTRALEEVATAEGPSLGDWEALSVVVRSGGRCTPTTLAQVLHLTSGTVSTRVNRLRDAGLVTVVGDVDGRSRPLVITDEGFGRWQRATARRTRSEREAFATLTGDQIDALNQLLRPLLPTTTRPRWEKRIDTTSRAHATLLTARQPNRRRSASRTPGSGFHARRP